MRGIEREREIPLPARWVSRFSQSPGWQVCIPLYEGTTKLIHHLFLWKTCVQQNAQLWVNSDWEVSLKYFGVLQMNSCLFKCSSEIINVYSAQEKLIACCLSSLVVASPVGKSCLFRCMNTWMPCVWPDSICNPLSAIFFFSEVTHLQHRFCFLDIIKRTQRFTFCYVEGQKWHG